MKPKLLFSFYNRMTVDSLKKNKSTLCTNVVKMVYFISMVQCKAVIKSTQDSFVGKRLNQSKTPNRKPRVVIFKMVIKNTNSTYAANLRETM